MSLNFLLNSGPEPDTDLSEVIYQWALRNQDRLARAFSTNRGWEVWSQIDLALFFQKKFRTVTTEREQSIYGPGTNSKGKDLEKQRADLVTTTQSGQKQIVELKVELNAKDDLLERVQADIEKIGGPKKGTFHQSFAVAICQTEGCYNKMKAFAASEGANSPLVYSLKTFVAVTTAGIFISKLSI